MGQLRILLHLGDLALILPLAIAISAWLAAARAWRLAFWWSLLFAFGAGLVGASKIVFLGWGVGLPALSFKSLSGHASGAMAVFPMLFYLVLQASAPRWRAAGAAAGILFALLLAVLLVAFGEHSAVETLGGCLLGAMASLGSLRLAGAPSLQDGPPLRAVVLAALTFAALAWLMKSAHVGYWMIKAARALSGNHHVYPLSID